jgi:hypothetical protein
MIINVNTSFDQRGISTNWKSPQPLFIVQIETDMVNKPNIRFIIRVILKKNRFEAA